MEPRAGSEGNANPQSAFRTQGRVDASQARERIRQAARRNGKEKFTALLRHVTTQALEDAFRAIARNAAAGVDGVTWRDYEADLERKLADLHARVLSGAYRATPSRRVYIPKPDGGRRPLAVAALEDKIVQRAVVDVLNAIYEEDFLGFTFICGQSRNGGFQLNRKSRADRVRTKLKNIKEGLRKRLHEPLARQGQWLGQVVKGWYNYHAVPTNSRALGAFRYPVVDLWRRSLRRRSQKDLTTWKRIEALASEWLPLPRILHPWPERRFAVKHPRWEPYAGIPHVRFCAGGAQ